MALLSFLVFVLLLPSLYSNSCSNRPRIFNDGVFIVGERPPMRCVLYAPRRTENDRFEWTQDGGNEVIDYQERNKEYKTQGSDEMVVRKLDFKGEVRPSDLETTFYCTIHYTDGKCEAKHFVVSMFVAPGPPTITGPKRVTTGQSFTWACCSEGTSGLAPRLEWSFGNNASYISYKEYKCPETITYENPANKLEAFRVSCSITRAVSERDSDFSLICKVIQPTTRRTAVSPRYTVNIGSTADGTGGSATACTGGSTTAGGTEGSTTADGTGSSESEMLALRQTTGTLPCKVDRAASVTKVRWFKNGNLLQTSSSRFDGSTTGKPSLTIWFMNKEDTGKYTCEVTQSSGKVTKTDTNLVVRYPPFIIHTKKTFEGRVGSDVELNCQFAALPKAVGVFWFKAPFDQLIDEVFIDHKKKPDKYSGGTPDIPNLTIKKLTKGDAGWYRCKADNEVGRGEGPVITLNVT